MLPLLSMIVLSGFDKAYIREYANKEVKSVSYYLILLILFLSLIVSFVFTNIYGITQYFVYILIGAIFGSNFMDL